MTSQRCVGRGHNRRFFLLNIFAIVIGALAASAGRIGDAADPPNSDQLIRIQNAIDKATTFLVEQQQPDGTWRSKTYGLLKDETSLTSLVMSSLSDSTRTRAARDLGLITIASWTEMETRVARVRVQPQFPAYTASLVIQVLASEKSDLWRRQAVVWQGLLTTHQLTGHNGWQPADTRFGGWSYSHDRPIKPDHDGPLSPLEEPNLSATVFALEGLASLQLPDSVLRETRLNAFQFVSRCQNWRESSSPIDEKFNDGGFHFVLDDPIRNKPGVAGVDSTDQTRFISYGSATADGLRSLLLCGLKKDHPRVVAAANWLTSHFLESTHPGGYPADRAHLQPSLSYYYAASLSRAFGKISLDGHDHRNGQWAKVIADRLMQLQRDDGSWSNPAVDVREDDPLIATSFALRALRDCLKELK